jgi:hypothetical protein
MAIKIAGTDVINNSRAIVNMSDIEGKYGQFHGTPETITTVLDMSKPIMRRTLSAPTTFTASNIATGKCAILLLDVSASGHLPTWPSSIQWPGDGTEPDWDASGVRTWLVGFTCWDSTTIRATATGWGTAPPVSGTLDREVTVGSGGYTATAFFGYVRSGSAGTYSTGAMGSIDDEAMPTSIYSSAVIEVLEFRDGFYYQSQQDDVFTLRIISSGGAPANSGWSLLTMDTGDVSDGGTRVLSRTSATYTTSGNTAKWVWTWSPGIGGGGSDSPRNCFVGATTVDLSWTV